MLSVDLTCSLPEFELAVDLSVGAGITALFGASGSGKTTLLQLIAGVRHARQGRIVWRDQVLFDSDQDICVPALFIMRKRLTITCGTPLHSSK